MDDMPTLTIESMTPPTGRRCGASTPKGIATGDATLEREAPDWDHFDRSHRADCRFVARATPGGPVLGWVALTAYSSRRVYSGVAWESVYVAADARGRGVGSALLRAVLPASEAAGLWTLMAGVMAENATSLAVHERAGFRQVGVQRAMGRDATGRWRDVVLLERRSQTVGTADAEMREASSG